MSAKEVRERHARIKALEAENARLTTLNGIKEGEVQVLMEGVSELTEQLDAAYAALRRAYRKSEVLDEPGYVVDAQAYPVYFDSPYFDTIKSAFEREENRGEITGVV